MKPTPNDRGTKIREHVFHSFSIQVGVSEKLNEKGFESIKCFFLSFFFIWRLALITSVSRIKYFSIVFKEKFFQYFSQVGGVGANLLARTKQFGYFTIKV